MIGLTPKVRARRSIYLDETFALDYISRMEVSLACLPTLRQRVKSVLEQGESLHTPQFDLQGKDLLGALRSLRCAVAHQCFILSRVISQRLAGRVGGVTPVFVRWPPLPGPPDDEAYWARVLVLEDKARVLSFVAARSIIGILEVLSSSIFFVPEGGI